MFLEHRINLIYLIKIVSCCQHFSFFFYCIFIEYKVWVYIQLFLSPLTNLSFLFALTSSHCRNMSSHPQFAIVTHNSPLACFASRDNCSLSSWQNLSKGLCFIALPVTCFKKNCWLKVMCKPTNGHCSGKPLFLMAEGHFVSESLCACPQNWS